MKAQIKIAALAAAFAASAAFASSLTADVIVVGSGLAGMTAALEIASQGHSVIVLEKQAVLGGASRLCGGQYAIQGSHMQKALGVSDDSPQSLTFDLLANGHLKNSLTLLKVQADNSPRVADWAIAAYKMQFVDQPLQYRAEFSHKRSLYLKNYCAGLYPSVEKAVREAGVKILSEMPADSIKIANGKVAGVNVVKNGRLTIVNSRAVVLATGGYGANKNVLVEPLKSALYYGPASSTGDGHRMAVRIGAQVENMQYGKRYPNGIEVAPGRAQSVIQGNYRAWLESGFLVNRAGKRVVNEKASNHSILTAMEQQPGKMLYLVMDAKTFEAFKAGIRTQGVTDDQISKWLAANGAKAPLFAHGKTLEEAARAAGIDGAALRATLERYNSLVAAKKDADFGRPAEFLRAQASLEGPYYIVEQKPRFATTMGSLVTDEGLSVLNNVGKPIPGLFAAGEIVNAVHGDDSAPGMNISWCLTSGKVAGENASDYVRDAKRW